MNPSRQMEPSLGLVKIPAERRLVIPGHLPAAIWLLDAQDGTLRLTVAWRDEHITLVESVPTERSRGAAGTVADHELVMLGRG